jgi:hypothetical protein
LPTASPSVRSGRHHRRMSSCQSGAAALRRPRVPGLPRSPVSDVTLTVCPPTDSDEGAPATDALALGDGAPRTPDRPRRPAESTPQLVDKSFPGFPERPRTAGDFVRISALTRTMPHRENPEKVCATPLEVSPKAVPLSCRHHTGAPGDRMDTVAPPRPNVSAHIRWPAPRLLECPCDPRTSPDPAPLSAFPAGYSRGPSPAIGPLLTGAPTPTLPWDVRARTSAHDGPAVPSTSVLERGPSTTMHRPGLPACAAADRSPFSVLLAVHRIGQARTSVSASSDHGIPPSRKEERCTSGP